MNELEVLQKIKSDFGIENISSKLVNVNKGKNAPTKMKSVYHFELNNKMSVALRKIDGTIYEKVNAIMPNICEMLGEPFSVSDFACQCEGKKISFTGSDIALYAFLKLLNDNG